MNTEGHIRTLRSVALAITIAVFLPCDAQLTVVKRDGQRVEVKKASGTRKVLHTDKGDIPMEEVFMRIQKKKLWVVNEKKNKLMRLRNAKGLDDPKTAGRAAGVRYFQQKKMTVVEVPKDLPGWSSDPAYEKGFRKEGKRLRSRWATSAAIAAVVVFVPMMIADSQTKTGPP